MHGLRVKNGYTTYQRKGSVFHVISVPMVRSRGFLGRFCCDLLLKQKPRGWGRSGPCQLLLTTVIQPLSDEIYDSQLFPFTGQIPEILPLSPNGKREVVVDILGN